MSSEDPSEEQLEVAGAEHIPAVADDDHEQDKEEEDDDDDLALPLDPNYEAPPPAC
ncbi:hypothetical protein OsI_01346 [Oryza sativa Indica Group]|uniref:Uncharacterized protein n=1 Tax=Oryza sativa subsp. indica TaxID=39946 RepID=B8AC99_ORYSI|nr:hypothetical protein OsI_01346 [Oryza sativa Indica Group]